MLAAGWQSIHALGCLCWFSLCVAALSSISPLPPFSSLPALTLPHAAGSLSLCCLTLFFLFFPSHCEVLKLYIHSCCNLPLISASLSFVLFFFCCAVSRTASRWKYVSPSPPIESRCVIPSWHHHHVHFFLVLVVLDDVGPNLSKWLPLCLPLSSLLSPFKKTHLVQWVCF